VVIATSDIAGIHPNACFDTPRENSRVRIVIKQLAYSFGRDHFKGSAQEIIVHTTKQNRMIATAMNGYTQVGSWVSGSVSGS
jgi:hypothetical protein